MHSSIGLIFLAMLKLFIPAINHTRPRSLLLQPELPPGCLECQVSRKCMEAKESPPVPPVMVPFTGIWMSSLSVEETPPARRLFFLPAFVQRSHWSTEEM